MTETSPIQAETSPIQAEYPSHAVVEAVAAREGVEPAALERTLYEAIDPDALNALVAATTPDDGPPLHVEFTYYGYEVRVSSGGAVSIARPA